LLRKIGKYWFIDISHPSLPKRLRFTTKTADKALAQKIHDNAFKEVLENALYGYRVKSIAYHKFISEFLEYSSVNHTPSTAQTYKFAFAKLSSILPDTISLKDIHPSDIERLKAKIGNKTTYNIYYNHLKAAFNYAIKWKYIKSNPLKEVKKFKINQTNRRDIHHDEFAKLIDTIIKDNNRPFAEFVIFMFIVGTRRKEILNLQWDNIHYDRSYFELKNTKGKKDALIPLNETLITILRNRPDGPKPFNYTPDHATKKFKHYCRVAELPSEIVLHSTRHATTTALFELHEDPLIVQNLVRHKDLNTTMNYTHTMPSFLKSAVDKTSDLVKDFLKKP